MKTSGPSHQYSTQSTIGMSREGIQRISAVFDDLVPDGINPGAQLTVMRNGYIVLDRFGGYADLRKKQRVSPETRFLTFSISKPFISMCIFKLIDEGLIELDGYVADYWPEFGCFGKEDITIRQVLLHQAGIPRRGLFEQVINLSQWEKLIENLAKKSVEYLPGSKTSYHALNFGFVLGEVISRVTGISVDEFLQQKYLSPLKLEHTSLKMNDFNDNSCARLYSGTLDHHLVALMFNSPDVREAVVPAASLHSTSREVAVFFQMLLNEGQFGGIQYLRPETVRLATSLGYEGYDESLRRMTRWGYGFYLGGEHAINPDLPDGMGKGSSLDTFGHYGQRTSLAFADKRTKLVVVFLFNQFLSSKGYKARLQKVSDAVWDAIEE